ncbi:MAG TPA: gfo/Idh/MocA family oxidoreductase [Verrucomicrobiales bacterium]|jgi:predicted dehydrogenase|nr:gfo/Idh/MocA family oxidoreductase [Verrucomicrobiales bacterium]HCL96504.1 gfo/Idh/MocA family oxidoreductase [Verrucomicrobiales bacterium]
MSNDNDDARELKAATAKSISAPKFPYKPPVPDEYRPSIALVGCGGIAKNHLDAYRGMGYSVVALCDMNLAAAESLRDEYFPEAIVTDDAEEIFAREDIEVVDLALHPAPRLTLIKRALEADKHVLSQKPFVTDIREGRKLVELAQQRGRKLAVNQNGRWAPYFSYLRQVLKNDLLGDIVSCDIHIAWDHTWIKGTHFENIHHILLYDFAIHWFDMVSCVFGESCPTQVFANTSRVPDQDVEPPLSAGALVSFDAGQASLNFHAATQFSPAETTVVTGTKGTFRSTGPVCANDQVTLTTAEGEAVVPLDGNWFNDGFAGAMGELLCAIEEDREPENSAKENLRSLELCFAAMTSADSGQPIKPGDILDITI